jgi:hypothetical protein
MKLVMILTSVLLLTGCVSPKSFVDTTYPKLTYEQIEKKAAPLKLAVTAQFQRNGNPLPAAETALKDNVERVLRASGVVVPTSGGAEGRIHVVVNNIADVAAAAGKGFGTGLTFGLVGSTVTDAYEMAVTITIGEITFQRTSVKHAIHTAIGNTTIPVGIETVTPQVAFERVLEQMLLRVLKDYQSVGGSPADATVMETSGVMGALVVLPI